MHKYIYFGGHVFNRYKILRVRGSNSFFVFYKLSVVYQKHWTVTSLTIFGNPDETDHFETMQYTFGTSSHSELIKSLQVFKDCPHAIIQDTSTPRTTTSFIKALSVVGCALLAVGGFFYWISDSRECRCSNCQATRIRIEQLRKNS